VPPSSATAPELTPLSARALPGWAEPFLDAPGEGCFFATRLWFDTLLAHALPEGAAPLLAADPGRAALLPLWRQDGRLASLTGDYSLAWRPLVFPRADETTLVAAGRSLAGLVRLRRPMLWELLAPAAPGLPPLLAGFRAGRAIAARFDSAGNWHEVLGEGASWPAYLAARDPALRTTITRKLARAGRTHRLEIVTAPGPALEDGIAAYEDVRGRSWKPHEPFPHFDAALLRAAAPAGLLRLGILREAEGGRAVAAQYWVLDRATDLAGAGAARRATVLKLAHDETARAASPGTVLTAMMVKLLIEEDGVRVLDFGRGDDAYKQLWVGARRQRIGFVIADPLSPWGAAALARQAAGVALRRVRR
jgi:hypothetical protein